MIDISSAIAASVRPARARRALVGLSRLIVIATLAGCAAFGAKGVRPGSAPLDAAGAWPGALIAAQSDVEQNRYADADKKLREFGAEHARTSEALESTYWRAVFMLDPANTAGTARDASMLLDRYLGSASPLMHRSEATVLQRIAKSLATREPAAPARVAADPAREPTRDPVRDPVREAARDAEMKALKDELEQTKAELERIRKRLAPPPATTTPPPPSADAE